MSHTAVIITVAYSIAVVLGAAISFAIFRSTRRPLDEDRSETWSRRETAWLVIMIVVLFALLMGTIFYVPYGDSAGPNAQYVRSPGCSSPGRSTRRRRSSPARPSSSAPTSEDVAHGFGVYNPDDVLIFQAQVVPDHVQKIVHTFTQPGRLHRSLPRVLRRGPPPDEDDVRREAGMSDERSLQVARGLTISY